MLVLLTLALTGVISYTDALVATLFSQNGVPASGAEFDLADVERFAYDEYAPALLKGYTIFEPDEGSSVRLSFECFFASS